MAGRPHCLPGGTELCTLCLSHIRCHVSLLLTVFPFPRGYHSFLHYDSQSGQIPQIRLVFSHPWEKKNEKHSRHNSIRNGDRLCRNEHWAEVQSILVYARSKVMTGNQLKTAC